MSSSEIPKELNIQFFSSKLISCYGMFSSMFFHNVRSKRKLMSFSENIVESNFLVKGVRPAQSPIIKMSACRCVSGFKSFLDVGVKGGKNPNLI